MSKPAADQFASAMSAVAVWAAAHEADHGDLEVLHRSNNVVVRLGEIVVKVGSDPVLAERDVLVASYASNNGGPAVGPVGLVEQIEGFSVSSWPFVPSRGSVDDRERARALDQLHRSLQGCPVRLPPLRERLEDGVRLLDDKAATAALGDDGRLVLRESLIAAVGSCSGKAVLHGEPHPANTLLENGRGTFIDFEGAVLGPQEWDLAFLPADLVDECDRSADRDLVALLRVAVSASVSVACWRHATARPDDAEMRWHAQHHLEIVRRAVR